MCSTLSQTSITAITADDIKNSNKLPKKQLGSYLLTLLGNCQPICHEENLDVVLNPPAEIAIKSLISEMTQSVQNTLNKFCESQDERFKEIHSQIAQLQSYSESLGVTPN